MLIPPARQRAFTLLELIVVLVVLAILASLAIPTFERVIERSRRATARASALAFGREVVAAGSFDGLLPVVTADVGSVLVDAPFVTVVEPLHQEADHQAMTVEIAPSQLKVTLIFSGSAVTLDDTNVDTSATSTPTAVDTPPWSGLGLVGSAQTGFRVDPDYQLNGQSPTTLFTAWHPVANASAYYFYVTPADHRVGAESLVQYQGQPIPFPAAYWTGTEFDPDNLSTRTLGHQGDWNYYNLPLPTLVQYTNLAQADFRTYDNTSWRIYVAPVIDGVEGVKTPALIKTFAPPTPRPGVYSTLTMTPNQAADQDEYPWRVSYAEGPEWSTTADSYYDNIAVYLGVGDTRADALADLQDQQSRPEGGFSAEPLQQTDGTQHAVRGKLVGWSCYSLVFRSPPSFPTTSRDDYVCKVR